jgi:predicted aminopeptidase
MRLRYYRLDRSPKTASPIAAATAAVRRRRRRLVLLLLSVALLASCSTLGYVGQAAWGQGKILLERRPIERLLEDSSTPEELREKLRAVEAIRDFAIGELGLPDNGSYRGYVELQPEADCSRKTAVVWNVVAAPELSTAPMTWCFPVAGCVAYRGYFSHRRADRFADRLRRKGYDVTVGGAAAYSTLGWFEDPLLSTVIDYPDVQLAGLIFHELAHQLVYVQDDTRFNESFATAVEIEGVRRWLAAGGRPEAELADYLVQLERQDAFSDLLLAARDRLQEIYDQEASDDWKRQRKREIFAELRTALVEVQASWGEAATLGEHWLEGEVNNADLASVGNYRELVPGFHRLLEEHGGDLDVFYAAVRELALLSPEERELRLASPPGEL